MINLLILMKLPRGTDFLPGTKTYFLETYQKLGVISRDEIISLLLFIVAIILAL